MLYSDIPVCGIQSAISVRCDRRFVALVRAVQGGLFSVITMTTGSTLVIDVTASRRRTDANIAFAWAGRFGMVVGLALGIYYLSFIGIFTISFIPVWLWERWRWC